ncbi:1-acyl-sn-glycerol-3-phosphate acyltransferase [Bacillus oleivorans]|uniref:1-acyl-sn-glycerol-3-phosphate acyltransferase n=1 Tax=Bacillus oleivorans TaxID=1448271 RepID=A0A285CL70_9BACI|nr:lysophospholipid acyltransferase family protein [Bacillus oleivorans]SNX68125.1 1-acyl-sn-glycerol-3-phosphate acyltransferase [Bacillus oleivorans]
MSFYHFAKTLVAVLLFPAYRIQVIGKENIPKEGGVLLCSNHISNLDPPVVGITCPRPISFMAKAELFNSPLFGKILKKVHAFPVKRGMSDREALRMGLKSLKDGHVLGLFPEGTRSKTGELGKGLAGAGFFAMRTDAKVVPCAIIGDYKFWGRIKVIYGKPIDFEEMREKKVSAEEATDHIMSAIKSLLDTYKQGSNA